MTRNILAERNIERLRAVASGGALLAFDYDGTLAPISNDPAASRMRDETSELLRNLAHAAPVAVITGRSVRDVIVRLEDIPMLAVIGNHGAEPSPFAKRAAREVTNWMPMLKAVVATLPQVEIEDKAMSVSVHYWHVTDPSVVIEAIDRLVPTLPHAVEVVHGIGIVNLIPHGAPNKGDALRRVMQEHALPGAVFVGDELTDESAFRVLDGDHSLGIRVGRWKDSAATFHIPTQLDIDALLTELLIGRTRPQERPHAEPDGSGSPPTEVASETSQLHAYGTETATRDGTDG
ncbi:MAG TPA: trehalose-phosphatase [Gemmatimonadaceae bacterium]|nr:trehalose-phosphatase [Gemmatimonadaceae bacterium]